MEDWKLEHVENHILELQSLSPEAPRSFPKAPKSFLEAPKSSLGSLLDPLGSLLDPLGRLLELLGASWARLESSEWPVGGLFGAS